MGTSVRKLTHIGVNISVMDDGSTLSWLFVALFLLSAAYFAAVETAFTSVSRIKLKGFLDRGDRRAQKALYILDNFDRAITTILIGVNIVQAAAAALVTVLVTRAWGLSAVTLSTILVTVVLFFAGEMLPKSIAKKYSGRCALWAAPSLCFFMRVFAPLSAVLAALGQFTAKHTRGDPEVTVTEDELYDIIENMTDEGNLPLDQGELVQSALEFDDVTAESVLTVRVDLAAVDIEDSPEEVLAYIKEQRHSRLPVYEDSTDNIIGILQIRKYIRAYLTGDREPDIRALMDEPFFAHSSTKISELLGEMSRKKLNMAVITDSYGGTLGIVTVEDILEELVGEIWDEDDDIEESSVPLGGGRYEMDAQLPVEEAFDYVEFEDPGKRDFGHKLLCEWAYEMFDHMPKERDSFLYNGLKVTVSDMVQHRIRKLVLQLLPSDTSEGGDAK